MRDGRTARIDRSRAHSAGVEEFLARHDVRLIAVAGDHTGGQFRLHRERHLIGRGPGVDLQVDDPALSRQHAAFEFAAGGFRVRDLGSTNGTVVNGKPIQAVELAHGDRIEIGSQTFQLLVETRDEEPDVYTL